MVASLVIGCAHRAPRQDAAAPIIRLKAKYDPGDVTWAELLGDNRIEGSALIRTRSGDVRTCAALETSLVPVSPYAAERMHHLYGNADAGFRSAGKSPVTFEPAYQLFQRPVRRAVCDPQGKFEFDNVPDGEWFIISRVYWEVPYLGMVLPAGGTLMQRVRVSGAKTTKIILAR